MYDWKMYFIIGNFSETFDLSYVINLFLVVNNRNQVSTCPRFLASPIVQPIWHQETYYDFLEKNKEKSYQRYWNRFFWKRHIRANIGLQNMIYTSNDSWNNIWLHWLMKIVLRFALKILDIFPYFLVGLSEIFFWKVMIGIWLG